MRRKILSFIILLTTTALTGCDGFHERRFLVPDSSARSDEVLELMSAHAKKNGMDCPDRDGFLLSCSKQPDSLLVSSAAGGTEVCYLSMNAQWFPNTRQEETIGQLQTRLTERFGATVTQPSEPVGTQCLPGGSKENSL